LVNNSTKDAKCPAFGKEFVEEYGIIHYGFYSTGGVHMTELKRGTLVM
jgi:hypothetical protein